MARNITENMKSDKFNKSDTHNLRYCLAMLGEVLLGKLRQGKELIIETE